MFFVVSGVLNSLSVILPKLTWYVMNMAFCPCSIEHAPQAIVCTWCIPGGATLSKEKEQVIHIHHDLNHLSNLEDVKVTYGQQSIFKAQHPVLGWKHCQRWSVDKSALKWRKTIIMWNRWRTINLQSFLGRKACIPQAVFLYLH